MLHRDNSRDVGVLHSIVNNDDGRYAGMVEDGRLAG